MAKKQSRKRYSIKATIFDKRGRVLTTGLNSYSKTHPYQYRMAKASGKPEAIYLHAEMAALVRLKDWSKAHSILVERYDWQGNPVSAKPCPICQSAIDRAGINIINHT